MEGICVNFLDQVQFFRFLKGYCHGNQLYVVSKKKTRAIFAIFTPYESDLGADDRSEFFFIISTDVAMATNFVAKLPTPLHLSLCHSEMEWDIALRINALTAPLIALYRVKRW